MNIAQMHMGIPAQLLVLLAIPGSIFKQKEEILAEVHLSVHLEVVEWALLRCLVHPRKTHQFLPPSPNRNTSTCQCLLKSIRHIKNLLYYDVENIVHIQLP